MMFWRRKRRKKKPANENSDGKSHVRQDDGPMMNKRLEHGLIETVESNVKGIFYRLMEQQVLEQDSGKNKEKSDPDVDKTDSTEEEEEAISYKMFGEMLDKLFCRMIIMFNVASMLWFVISIYV